MRTYHEAAAYLGAKEDRPLPGRATRIHRREDGSIGIRYQSTDVVIYHPSKRITLQTGGWQSATTKGRINEYTSARIYASKGIWYFQGGILFRDGATIREDGSPIRAKGDAVKQRTEEKAIRSLDRKVSAYIKGYAALVSAGGLEDPSSGDCWGCSMTVAEDPGVSQGTRCRTRSAPHGRLEPMGIDHYLSHMTEEGRYYVPSLLWNAIKSRGYGDPAYVWQAIKGRKDGRWAAQILRGFFRDLMPALRTR